VGEERKYVGVTIAFKTDIEVSYVRLFSFACLL